MLREIFVENVGIIERSLIRLSPGLTALTGETGAGKSLLVDAVGLALGDRADASLVRSGESRATVSIKVSLQNLGDMALNLSEAGIRTSDNELTILREIASEGRSNCRVNGKSVPLALVRSLSDMLIDLHGQHEHQSLLEPTKHLQFLDAWIGAPAQELLDRLLGALNKFTELRKELNSLQESSRLREHELELLRHQVQEISEAEIVVGELDQLELGIQRLNNVEKLAEFAAQALDALSRADGARDEVATASRLLASASNLDSSLQPIVAQCNDVLFQLEDCIARLSSYQDGLESDPKVMELQIERCERIKKLLRKYGGDEATLLQFAETAQRNLDNLENAETRFAELERAVADSKQIVDGIASELSLLRQQKAPDFSEAVRGELLELAMEKAQFKCFFEEKSVDLSGADAFEFLFSANPGELLRPLARIASGGEISRVMLALKVVLAGKAGAPTLIFDEVDIGLSGRAAAVVAKKLRKLSSQYQVIVISHLPQIAAAADHHFQIQKSEIDGRTVTGLKHLADDERVDEIARMLAGETVGASALANAKELLHLSK